MPTTSVRDIDLMLPGSFGKETLSNDGMQNLALGISGAATIPLAGTDVTLTEGAIGQAQHFVQILTGTLTANVTVVVPAESRVYIADNRTTGAFTVTFRTAAGSGIAVDQAARTLVYCDGTNVYPVASGTGGSGGSGAPTDASYLVGASHTLLSGERVVTNTPTVTWDLATAGQAKAVIPPDAISYAHLQNVTPTRLLGRFTAVAGDVQEITPGTGLTLDASGVLSATAVGQPLDATLTALAGVTTSANTMEYFTGVDVAASTPLTPLARTLLDDTTQAAMQATIGVVPGTHVQPADATLTAIAGVTTGADVLQFFTGVDTASTTPLSPLARALLDDTTQAAMQATIGVAGGGGGSTDFLGLTDTPDSYSGQAGKAVVVNAGATALEFGTAIGGASDFLMLTDTPDTYAGQAGKGVVVNGAATGLEFTTAVTGSYDLGVTWAGTLPASQVMLRYPFPRAVDFPAGLTGSCGVAAVAATATTTLDLRKNGTSVGSAQWAAAGTTATFTLASATSFAAGDVLTVHAPGTADATLADLGLSLAGTRAVAAGEMGATTWLGLTDTPNAYTGQGGKVVQVNAGATATEFGPVLGTMATQDASAVAITGGSAQLTGTVDGTYALKATEFVQTRGVVVLDSNAPSISAFYSTMQAAGATDKAAIRCQGDAPSYFGGNVGIKGAAAYPLDVTGNARVSGTVGVGIAPSSTAQVSVEFDKNARYGLTFHQTVNDAGGFTPVLFTNIASTIIGSISTTASATSFNTSSDARLKHAIAPLTGSLDVIAALNPIRFRWNATDEQDQGFLAHELMQQVRAAVTGQPDEVNEDGSIRPQQVDHSKLVPWLTAGIKELLARIEVLEAAILAL